MHETVRDHERPRLAVAPTMAQVDADLGPAELDRVSSFLTRNWVVLGAAALLGAVAGLVGSHFLTKVYRAEVLIVPVHDATSPLKSAMGGIGAIASFAGVDINKVDDHACEAGYGANPA